LTYQKEETEHQRVPLPVLNDKSHGSWAVNGCIAVTRTSHMSADDPKIENSHPKNIDKGMFTAVKSYWKVTSAWMLVITWKGKRKDTIVVDTPGLSLEGDLGSCLP
jgi:hypothetical protein